MSKRLDAELFQCVVASTPLVSIDLIVQNSQGKVLLGQRLNRPAQGFWFVPGGRIRKDETMEQAFIRLAQEELGIIASGLADATFLGPYEHFYDDNFCNENFSTHYVVLGYKLTVDLDIDVLPNDQHKAYRWLSTDDLLAANDVHINTKFYFSHRI